MDAWKDGEEFANGRSLMVKPDFRRKFVLMQVENLIQSKAQLMLKSLQ
uniref:Uncharacterized protein n=1 Tax=Arundo donax TaxID=35708 RepID=A0A0A8ZGN4_ARUDO